MQSGKTLHINWKWFLLSMTILMAWAFFLSGCNMPGQEPSPTVDMGAQQTQAAQTVSAKLTQESPSATEEQTAILITPQQSPTSSLTNTPTETLTPSPTNTQEAIETVPPLQDYRVILDDDFSSGTGWYEADGENFGFLYTEDGYKIFVNILNATIWSIRDIQHEDIRLQVDAEQTAGNKDGYYGVACRHQDEDNYYALVISNNSQYGIARMLDGDFEFILEGTAQEGLINSDGTNQITADCIDNSLILYANNMKLAEIQDNAFSSGIFGLVAGTRLSEGFEAEFHRIIVSVP